METKIETQVNKLRTQVTRLLRFYSNADIKTENLTVSLPEDFKKEFLNLIDQVNLGLMDDNENFFGYFLLQMERELRTDLSSPTGVNFKRATYVIYFNPLIFLNLNQKQMETSIKHEILHILSLHLIRAKKLKEEYSDLAMNTAMDLVVNQYLCNLPTGAVTLEGVNQTYALSLKPFQPFEYYAQKIQHALDLTVDEKDNGKQQKEGYTLEYDMQTTHDIWNESDVIDENTWEEFTKKTAITSSKGDIPSYIETLLDALKNSKVELPWTHYLSRLMGTLESSKKKTITRRNRRQPNRLDLRGELSGHKANILIALDISGSIDTDEFTKAMIEVLGIVKNYGHKITIVECDNEIRRAYQIKTEKDLKDRLDSTGGTLFTPVFEYANHNKFNLVIYFTDGKGEDKLGVIPRGYQILWVLAGREDKLSLKNPYGIVKKLMREQKKEMYLDSNDVERGGYSMNNQEGIL